MIRLLLSGGLGNQMFQYAAGKCLSLRTNLELSIDTQLLEKKTRGTKRNYELDVFNINEVKETKSIDKLTIKGFQFLNETNFASDKIFNIFKDKKAQEYDERFKFIDKSIILFGYFQNENYFKDFSEQLRVYFGFTPPLNGKNEELHDILLNNNSISIHIRRSDYLNHDSNLKPLGFEYYRKAIEYILSKVDNPFFIVFSDDIAWAKDNLRINGHRHIYVDWNRGKESYKDMQLMSLCKHNIIANSSFSWWGAWLNHSKDKLVIVPDKWYKNDTSNNYPDGFIPNGWNIL